MVGEANNMTEASQKDRYRSDLERVIAERRDLEAQAAKIAAEIVRLNRHVDALRVLLDLDSGKAKSAAPAGTAGAPSANESGLRAAIVQLLFETPGGLKPIEIARTLLERGFKYAGKTPFPARVNGEIHRMRKAKLVYRRKNGNMVPGKRAIRAA